jgi:hypothetical protein
LFTLSYGRSACHLQSGDRPVHREAQSAEPVCSIPKTSRIASCRTYRQDGHLTVGVGAGAKQFPRFWSFFKRLKPPSPSADSFGESRLHEYYPHPFPGPSVLLCLEGAGMAGPRCRSCVRTTDGRIARSSQAKREFRRMEPCPATGETSGPCPGYVIDHRIDLFCGGEDDAANMQWQTRAEAKAKDRWEQDCSRRRFR